MIQRIKDYFDTPGVSPTGEPARDIEAHRAMAKQMEVIGIAFFLIGGYIAVNYVTPVSSILEIAASLSIVLLLPLLFWNAALGMKVDALRWEIYDIHHEEDEEP